MLASGMRLYFAVYGIQYYLVLFPSYTEKDQAFYFYWAELAMLISFSLGLLVYLNQIVYAILYFNSFLTFMPEEEEVTYVSFGNFID